MGDGQGEGVGPSRPGVSDAEQAIRYLAIKAAIFILLPAVVAVGVAVWVLL